MSLTRKVAHNTIIQIVGKIITTILGLVAFAMLARFLGQEKFGWYITVTAFLQFAGVMIDFGMIVVTAQMLSEPFKDKEKLFKNLFTFRIITAIFFFAIRKEMSFLDIMVIIIISSITHTAILWIKALKETKIALAFDWDIWKKIITKMWPIALSIIFNVVYLKGDLVLLSIFVDQKQIGIYGAAYRVLDVITQSAMMIMGVLLPLMAYAWSRKLKKDFQNHYQRSFDTMMLFAVPMMVGAIVLGDKIILLLFGADFVESGTILQILSI